MVDVLLPFTAVAAFAVALGFLVVWSRRAVAPRIAAVVLSAAVIAVVGASLIDQLGRPKPVRVEWMQAQGSDADVLGSRIVEGKGIYLWLGLPGSEEPRAYVLPWDLQVANELQKAVDEAARTGGTARGKLPFERSWDDREPKFYALPQPKMPDKPEPEKPLQYERDA